MKHDNIVILTYDIPHRKTQDLTINLITQGYDNVSIVATKFVIMKNHRPFFYHRPNDYIDVDNIQFFKRLGVEYIVSDDLKETLSIINPKYILIGGAKVLDGDIVKDRIVVNSHPGYLPMVRGLDALKWAVYNSQPIGVTSHIVDGNVDAGILIEREIMGIKANDTFHSIAMRQYLKEIELLVRAIPHIESGEFKGTELSHTSYPVHGRMPMRKEYVMIKKLENIINESLE